MKKDKNESMKKEVKKDMKKALAQVRKDKKEKKKEKKTDNMPEKIQKMVDSFEDSNELDKKFELAENMDGTELAEWLIDSHNILSKVMSVAISDNFLNEVDFEARYHICLYILQFAIYLEEHGVKNTISEETLDVLIQEDQVELLSILGILNYI